MDMIDPIDSSEISRLLRAALDDAASRIDIAPDALATIRTHIAAQRRWWRAKPSIPSTHPRRGATMFRLGAGTGLAVTTTVAAVVLGMGTCSSAPATGPTPSSSPSSVYPNLVGASGDAVVNLPIYYVGPTAHGLRLYREYHRLTVGDASVATKVRTAVTAMVGHTAYDTDYTSPWPPATAVASVTVAGNTVTVSLHTTMGGKATSGNAYNLALEQLVWTVTAVSGLPVVNVRFDGATASSNGLRRGPAVDALAPVWVIDPQANATTGTAVTVHLAGIVFEGTIQLRVRNASGTVVSHRTVQLSVGAPAQGTATVQLTLAPGRYTIEAYEVSAKDSSIVALDGHPFTVK